MTTKILKVFKETAVPSTWVADSVYFISHPTNADVMECYATSSTGVPRRILNEADITGMIASQISSSNELQIVADIAERDALTPTAVVAVYVQDAIDDTTVSSGGAYYLYDVANDAWIKTGEAENLDVSLDWASIQNKPTSTVAQIDGAVADSHTHANKVRLDKVAEDAGGNMTYNGSLPYTGWEKTDW